MRIAYIAPYQGPLLVSRRPSSRNLSLAGRVKMGLIAELLQRGSHTVEIFSQGEVIERRFKFYPGFSEPEASNPDIPVHYASAFPVRFLNGLWSSNRTLRLFKAAHRRSPFQLVVIYNLKSAQLACANYAMKRLGLPVILEYEDDVFVDVHGRANRAFLTAYHEKRYAAMLQRISGCIAVSPYLLTHAPASVPKLLLRGVVSGDIVKLGRQTDGARNNWVVFSGTHERTQGLEQMIQAWRRLRLPDWELHLAGQGPITEALHKLAQGDSSIHFHGYLNREENARLLCQAKIGMNPQDVTSTPGNVFALKIIEYLAARLHVLTTPRGMLEPELEEGITYVKDNTPETLADCLGRMIAQRVYDRTAQAAALKIYGPEAIERGLCTLVEQVVNQHRPHDRPASAIRRLAVKNP